jgi:hypothetical protein
MRRAVATLLLLLTLPVGAFAQGTSDTLSGCLADQTSGRDRKDLARWIFFAIGAHPENKPFLAAGSAQATDDANRTAAALLMRLVTESCVVQTRAAIKQGGAQAIQIAFEAFGKLAMQELMSNPEVGASMGALDKYLDQQKLVTALGGK